MKALVVIAFTLMLLQSLACVSTHRGRAEDRRGGDMDQAVEMAVMLAALPAVDRRDDSATDRYQLARKFKTGLGLYRRYVIGGRGPGAISEEEAATLLELPNLPDGTQIELFVGEVALKDI